MIATETATRYWTTRHETYGPGWTEHYWESWRAPHRQQIVRALERIGPWDSLLELGCGPGANLRLIHGRWPGARLHGLDGNADAVAYTRARMAEFECSDRVTVEHDRLPDGLLRYTDGFDVILSCYALAYLDPGDLARALHLALGLARVAVVIAEPMVIDPADAEGLAHESSPTEWRHDYLGRSMAIGPPDWHATLERVDPPVDRLNGLLILRRR